ncbi:hypothetical protein [Thermogemmatispora tikiterensis]|uniref:Membrane protein 6-pyruvoyl-tetrahydropterin synthase-related domain-containing protein n=1 Tax=Thermogemmatispora tikiterensis TaxID=1825093 RepID=A0A328V9W3_9CHLR|nr:hypothetical protein [Thermogemmatispora tikiterensis]RAQ94427.1 hypothetical protein A4R35_02705 [Thermogemmatispora tikiterensis]
MSTLGPWLKRWLVGAAQVALLLLVGLLIQWPAPVSDDQLVAAWPGSDLVVSHWPMVLELQRTVAQAHRFPLWNPYFGGGLPLGADPLAALFYPPTQLVHFFSLRNYFFVLMTLHFFWAGLGTLLLARRVLALPRWPALVAAISYMATPRLISHLGAGHVTIMQTVCWYPWLALTTWATVRQPLRWGPALALCVAMTLLAGHPQMAYYGLLMLATVAAWLLLQQARQEGWRPALFSATGLLVACSLGVALAGIHLLPLLELMRYSTRAYALHPKDQITLTQFLHSLVNEPPLGWITWEGMVAPGLSVLCLAVFGFVSRMRKTWPLVLGVVLVASLAMGQASWVYLVAHYVLPGFDRFRGLARIWFLGLLGLALLAGLGASTLTQALRRQSRVASLAVGVLLLALVATNLVLLDQRYSQVGSVSLITRPSRVALAAQQLAGNGRIYGVQENIPQLTAAELELRLADGADPLLIGAYVQYMDRAGGYYSTGYQQRVPYDAPWVQPDPRLLGLLHVTVLVSKRPLQDSHLLLAGKIDGTFLYRNSLDAGPAYLLRPGSNGQLPSLDHYQLLPATIQLLRLQDDEQSFRETSATGGYLVVATTAYPGWIALLDGQRVPVQSFAGLMPAIRVGPGTHTLSYLYRPASVLRGAALAALGLLTLLLWLAGWQLYRRGRLPRMFPRWPHRSRAALVGSVSSPASPEQAPSSEGEIATSLGQE